MMIYDVIAVRYKPNNRPDVVLFYDENREMALKYMRKYVKSNGFSIENKDRMFSVANIVLRERTSTGEEIGRQSYRELFDILGKRL